MKLSLNTYLYECAGVPIMETLKSAAKLGFKYLDYAAIYTGDPTKASPKTRKQILSGIKDNGLVCSQLQLAHTRDLASSNAKLREKGIDYMKRCAEFLMEMNGRQMLVWWGCGVLEFNLPREQSWMNAVNSMRKFAEWCLPRKLLIDLELEPFNFSFLNNTEKMVKMLEDIALPNVNANIDIGHMSINREGPLQMEKFGHRILHAHISETDSFDHTNSIIGTGNVDYKSYVKKMMELGIEQNCKKAGVPCAAGIEMGSNPGSVDDPERWIKESLAYLKKILPELKQ